MVKSVSTYVASIKSASIGTTYDVNMGDYCNAQFGNGARYFKKKHVT